VTAETSDHQPRTGFLKHLWGEPQAQGVILVKPQCQDRALC